MKNKEQVYDDQISPLMTQIIAICRENKIAAFMTFDIPTEEHPDLKCTTALASDGEKCTGYIQHVNAAAQNYNRPPVFAFTVSQPKKD